MSGSSCARRRPLPFLPENVHGKEVVVMPVFYAGDFEEGKRQVEPLADSRSCTANTSTRCRTPPGRRPSIPLAGAGGEKLLEAHNFTQLADGALDTMIASPAGCRRRMRDLYRRCSAGRRPGRRPDATAYGAARRDLRDERPCALDSAKDDQAASAGQGTCSGLPAAMRLAVSTSTHDGQDEAERVTAAYGTNLPAPGAGQEEVRPGQHLPGRTRHRAGGQLTART